MFSMRRRLYSGWIDEVPIDQSGFNIGAFLEFYYRGDEGISLCLTDSSRYLSPSPFRN